MLLGTSLMYEFAIIILLLYYIFRNSIEEGFLGLTYLNKIHIITWQINFTFSLENNFFLEIPLSNINNNYSQLKQIVFNVFIEFLG